MTDWVNDTGERPTIIKSALAIWQQKFPNVAVDLQAVNGLLAVRVAADFAAGTPADVVLGIAVPRDNFVDLLPFIKRDKIDQSQFGSLDPYYQYKGGQIGIPFSRNAQGIFYFNRSLFQRVSVAGPTDNWTLNELADAAQRVSRPEEGRWRLAADFTSLFRAMLLGAGTAETTPDGKNMNLNTPQAAAAARWLVERIGRDRSFVASRFPEIEPFMAPGLANSFQTGRVGMLNIHLGYVGVLESTVGFRDFDWDLMPPLVASPAGKVTPRLIESPHTVSRRPGRSAEQTDAAVAFTVFMSGEDVMEMIAEGRTGIPVQRAVLNGTRYLRQPPTSTRLIPKLIETARYALVFDGQSQVSTAVETELKAAWAGTVSPDAALANAQLVGQGILAQYQQR